MVATREDIAQWFDNGVKLQDATPPATHMLVICDKYDWSDYPVYFHPTNDEIVIDMIKHYDAKDLTKVMEVYDLRMDKEEQLNEHRAWHVELHPS